MKNIQKYGNDNKENAMPNKFNISISTTYENKKLFNFTGKVISRIKTSQTLPYLFCCYFLPNDFIFKKHGNFCNSVRAPLPCIHPVLF